MLTFLIIYYCFLIFTFEYWSAYYNN